MSESVIKVFIDLHEKGLIYRGYKMVNWDPEAKTTLSNEEVVFVEEETKIFLFLTRFQNQMMKYMLPQRDLKPYLETLQLQLTPKIQGIKNLLVKMLLFQF